MNQVLLSLCRAAVFLTSDEILLTPRQLAATTRIPSREVSKILRDLEREGLIRYTRRFKYDSWMERRVSHQGWEITRRAYETAEFDVALDIETMWLSHFANGELEADPYMAPAHYWDIRHFLDPRRVREI
jgi:DNA-binding transcriptional regulator YhcF (GntR family)